MIYLDSSVALVGILVEDRRPPPSLWQEPLFSSRMLEYEVWVRLNARDLYGSHGNVARALINRITFIELRPEVLERVLKPFPVPVRTLDALHLASMAFLLKWMGKWTKNPCPVRVLDRSRPRAECLRHYETVIVALPVRVSATPSSALAVPLRSAPISALTMRLRGSSLTK